MIVGKSAMPEGSHRASAACDRGTRCRTSPSRCPTTRRFHGPNSNST